MTENVENLMLEHLKKFQAGQDRIERKLDKSSRAWVTWKAACRAFVLTSPTPTKTRRRWAFAWIGSMLASNGSRSGSNWPDWKAGKTTRKWLSFRSAPITADPHCAQYPP